MGKHKNATIDRKNEAVKRARLWSLAVAVTIAGLSACPGATLNVPGGYSTIQAAIAAAADGDTVQVAAGTYHERLSWSSKSIRLIGAGAGLTIVDADGVGSCLYLNGVPSTALIRGFTFTGGLASWGGGIFLYYSSPTLMDNTITGNTSTYDWIGGGGICVYLSSPTLIGNVITENSAPILGGGVYVYGASSPILNDNKITDNAAPNGAGIHVNGASLTMTDNEITGNQATGSGGRGAGLAMYSASGSLTGNTITGNTAHGTWPGGGGILLDTSSPTLTGNVISDNAAPSAWGGGLYLWDSSPVLANNQIRGNTAMYWGGGLCVGGGSSPAVGAGNIVAENTALRGGGLYFSQSSGSVSDSIIEKNVSTDKWVGGGGICLTQSSPTITGNIIRDNSALLRGAGLFIFDASSPILRNNQITANRAPVGAGLYVSQGSLTMTDNQITDNTGGRGAGLAMYDGASGVLTGNTIAGNTAHGDWPGGGGILLDNSSPTLTGNFIRENVTTGIYAAGAGIYVIHASPTMTDNQITDNTGGRGAGLAMYDDASGVLTGNTITGNTADGDWPGGGGVLLVNASPTLTGNFITDNAAASAWGGGLYLDSSSPVLADNDILRNTAGFWGGGICAVEGSSPVVEAGNIVAGNSASRGGGLHFSQSSGTIDGTAITGNTATDLGGGLSLEGSFEGSPLVLLANNKISNNTAGASGGGLWAGEGSSLVIEPGNIVDGNTANKGGGLFFLKSSGTIDGATITGNTAVNASGGGVFLTRSSSASLTDCTIAGNTAGKFGGGLFDAGTALTLDGNSIAANTAFEGGGLYLLRSSGLLAGNTVTGNNPEGIRLRGASPVISGNIITGNTSDGIRMIVFYGSDGDPASASLDMLAQPTISGNTIAVNGGWGILAADTAAANAGTLAADNPLLEANGEGRLLQWWYGLVKVTRADGNPAAGATVTVHNFDGSTSPGYDSPFVSAPDGYAPDTANPTDCRTWLQIVERFIDNAGGNHMMTPHSLSATLVLAQGETTHSWTERLLVAVIQLNPPPVVNAGLDQVGELDPEGWDLKWLEPKHGKGELEFLISFGGGAEEIDIHTSGSQELEPGTRYGDFILTSVVREEDSDPGKSKKKHAIRGLELTYVGEAPVDVVAYGKKGGLWEFPGLQPGELFYIDAGSGNHLDTETTIVSQSEPLPYTVRDIVLGTILLNGSVPIVPHSAEIMCDKTHHDEPRDVSIPAGVPVLVEKTDKDHIHLDVSGVVDSDSDSEVTIAVFGEAMVDSVAYSDLDGLHVKSFIGLIEQEIKTHTHEEGRILCIHSDKLCDGATVYIDDTEIASIAPRLDDLVLAVSFNKLKAMASLPEEALTPTGEFSVVTESPVTLVKGDGGKHLHFDSLGAPSTIALVVGGETVFEDAYPVNWHERRYVVNGREQDLHVHSHSHDEQLCIHVNQLTEPALVYLDSVLAVTITPNAPLEVTVTGHLELDGDPDTFDGSFEGTDEIEIVGSLPKDYEAEVFYEWIHTSGSKPLDAGDLFGDFMVVDVTMTDDTKPKISSLTLVYIGPSSHELEPIDINVYSKDRKTLIGSVTGVSIEDEVTVDGADLKQGHLESDVLLEYYQ